MLLALFEARLGHFDIICDVYHVNQINTIVFQEQFYRIELLSVYAYQSYFWKAVNEVNLI